MITSIGFTVRLEDINFKVTIYDKVIVAHDISKLTESIGQHWLLQFEANDL